MTYDDEMNVTEVMIGCQGSGKSWEAMQRAAVIADKYDCPIIIHDCGTAAIRKANNPYHECDWEMYRDSPLHGDKTKRKEVPYLRGHDIYLVNTAVAEDVMLYAEKIQKGGNGHAVVLIDEVSAAISISPQHIGEPWRTAIAQRRAMKIALIFCMQYPTMASRFMRGTATAVKCFRLDDKDDIAALRKLKFSDEQVERVPTLKRGEYIEISQGFSSIEKID